MPAGAERSYEGYPKSLLDWFYAGAWTLLAAIKNAVVSAEPRYRRVKAGPARGATLYTSYRYGTRTLLGLFESELIPYLKRYVHPGSVCYDIGAYGGYYTFAFAKLAAPGRVYAFDSDAQAIDQIEILKGYNAHLGSVIALHRIRIEAAHVDDLQTSLDHLVYVQGWTPPDVIKIDVDGGELDILRGSARLLRERHPRLIVEIHSADLERACRQALEHVGYRPTLVKNRALMAEFMSRRSHNRWLCAD